MAGRLLDLAVLHGSPDLRRPPTPSECCRRRDSRAAWATPPFMARGAPASPPPRPRSWKLRLTRKLPPRAQAAPSQRPASADALSGSSSRARRPARPRPRSRMCGGSFTPQRSTRPTRTRSRAFPTWDAWSSRTRARRDCWPRSGSATRTPPMPPTPKRGSGRGGRPTRTSPTHSRTCRRLAGSMLRSRHRFTSPPSARPCPSLASKR
mmetsp:Transcript_21614/g.49802  ORF Transcript_21614/g.49802 Transcript_21614/m.49802 type:complete len:208 (+) Transcript_21614:284-907(+)